MQLFAYIKIYFLHFLKEILSGFFLAKTENEKGRKKEDNSKEREERERTKIHTQKLWERSAMKGIFVSVGTFTVGKSV